jgi:hypothetical protein
MRTNRGLGDEPEGRARQTTYLARSYRRGTFSGILWAVRGRPFTAISTRRGLPWPADEESSATPAIRKVGHLTTIPKRTSRRTL